MKIITLFFIFFFSTGWLLLANELRGKSIKICDDDQWPPFSENTKVNGKVIAIGFSIDVINEIFKSHDIQAIIELKNFKRCLSELEGGQKYQMALSASYSEERQQKFLFTKEYYNLERLYFYSKKIFPKGLKIEGPQDFDKYKIGGIHGYNYESYGIKNKQVSRRVDNYFQLVDMMHRQRGFDIFVARFEIIATLKREGKSILLDQNLGYAPIKGLDISAFHMLVSKQYKYHKELKVIIDNGISKLERSGQLQSILEKYIPQWFVQF